MGVTIRERCEGIKERVARAALRAGRDPSEVRLVAAVKSVPAGKILEAVEAGVEMLQFDQPDLYGIDNLEKFQEMGKITFWCPVDIQTTLQTRDEKIIRAKARQMLEKLWKGCGGFVAGYYEDYESIGLEPEAQDWACDEFVNYGKKIYFE